jgi:hypothetical protein
MKKEAKKIPRPNNVSIRPGTATLRKAARSHAKVVVRRGFTAKPAQHGNR